MRDTIYREEAIKKIAEHLGMPAENWMGIAEEWLREVPSAQPEKMRGKWKEHKDYPNLAYLCSECDCFATVRSYFCPNCGADMRGEL